MDQTMVHLVEHSDPQNDQTVNLLPINVVRLRVLLNLSEATSFDACMNYSYLPFLFISKLYFYSSAMEHRNSSILTSKSSLPWTTYLPCSIAVPFVSTLVISHGNRKLHCEKVLLKRTPHQKSKSSPFNNWEKRGEFSKKGNWDIGFICLTIATESGTILHYCAVDRSVYNACQDNKKMWKVIYFIGSIFIPVELVQLHCKIIAPLLTCHSIKMATNY